MSTARSTTAALPTAVPKRDRRRAALLSALSDLLESGDELDSINIAEISRRAGVSRSAFYFYFENKAMAVAALSEEFYEASVRAAELLQGPGDPAANIAAMVGHLFRTWERHSDLYRAMLDARQSHSAVRQMWDADRASFVPVIAAAITAAGAPPGIDAEMLGSVLLDLNDRTLERLARDPDVDRERLQASVVHVWLSAVHGWEPASEAEPARPREETR